MLRWLKAQDWYWRLYYEWEIVPGCMPMPDCREWNVLLLPGMEPPFPMRGYAVRIHRAPTGDSNG